MPSFADAIHQSFANQTMHSTAILTIEEHDGELYFAGSETYYPPRRPLHLDHPPERPYSLCPTCALIAEGSSMSYSDDTCPQVLPVHNKRDGDEYI